MISHQYQLATFLSILKKEKTKKETLKLSPQQMINCEKFYDCLLNLLVIEVMLYFMPIKKTKLEPYIPIILERAGNYNVIFWYRYLFIFYFGITSLSFSLSLSIYIYIYYTLFVLLLHFSQHQNYIGR